jgi:hypothetical protein
MMRVSGGMYLDAFMKEFKIFEMTVYNSRSIVPARQVSLRLREHMD